MDDVTPQPESKVKLILGGEAVLPSHMAVLKALLPCARIYNEYGPTEATIGCIVKELHHDEPVLIGKPIRNMHAYIVDKNGELMPPGVPGEIWLSGKSVAAGYINRPELTSEKFCADPFTPGHLIYKTGDLGRWHTSGEIEYIGRMDDQVKIRGFRVETGECTEVLASCAGIKNAIVVATGIEGDKGLELVGYYVPEQVGVAITVEDLQLQMLKQLPQYMVPVRFVMLPAMPLTNNGKIDKNKLPLPEVATTEDAKFIAPATDIEQIVANIWSEVLKIANPGMLDNFFAFGWAQPEGGKLTAAIMKATGVKIPLKKIFEAQNLREIVQYVERTSGGEYEAIPRLPACSTLLGIKCSETDMDR